MTNRPAGGARSKKHERADYDWYKEPRKCNRQIFDTIEKHFPCGPPERRDLIYDPCAGSGWILDEAKERGHPTLAGDIIDRSPRHQFKRGNFLDLKSFPKPMGREVSIVSNPPYSYEDDIAEKIMRRALSRPIHRAMFLLPIAFLASQSRYGFFARDYRPSHVCIFCERHSMPPGKMIDTMAKPFSGTMQDYCLIVYTGPRHKWRTETIWVQPS